MNDEHWEQEFRAVWNRAVKAYESGADSAATCIPPADRAFLASIGVTAQELFDFAEDWVGYSDPPLEEVVRVTAIQRGYFLKDRAGKPPGPPPDSRGLPAKSDEVDGIAWLPRLIVKARLKLAGQLPPDLMYGCGGDRPFLRRMRVGLAEFLQKVRDSGGNDRAVIDFVKERAGLR